MKLFHRILGEGQPIIIMHGLFGSSDNWQTFGKFWSERAQVILVDLRNHGHSPHSDEMNYAAMAEDLHELIEDLGLEEPIILGHSMGGKVAMQFAHSFPNKAKAICIGDIGIKGYPPHHQQILEALTTADLERLKSRKEVDAHLAKFIPEVGVRHFLAKSLYWIEKGQLAWRFNVPVLSQNIAAMTKAIDVEMVETETLFIRGSKSNYILDQDIPLLLSTFASSEVKTLEGVGHWIHAEDPKGFNAYFEAFFDQTTK